ncbi:HD-GYP domain-containing protein [Desulfatitalea alkaliphila]|uniref:HD-GYP domain-containing protein n=1 Tax=Desulfatitalea alkaliphila TaxID=2929485 RepID=A0AA41UNY5_9BACT|nr:HD-GYP domain-containing protein [Desulfatitalea alkaliphila]MCJ8499963.1 HD-GYP domain-containing protein [Desulfatitalea alkaliphila]
MTETTQWTPGKAGEVLLNAIHSMTRITRLHSDNNDQLRHGAEKFTNLMAYLGKTDDRVTIRHTGGRFYFQESNLPIRPANHRLLTTMRRFLENRGIYGLQFQTPLPNVLPLQIIAFFRLIDQAIVQPSPAGWLAAQCEAQQWTWVAIEQKPPAAEDRSGRAMGAIGREDPMVRRKAHIRRSYAHALSAVKEVATKLSANQSVAMRHSVRLVQGMVDILAEDESLFLGISTIRIYDDYTYAHSINVAILSMCLGRRIGLSRSALERLGLCGLFHDLGKTAIPKEILNKRGKLTEAEFDLIKSHAVHSSRLILKLKAQRERKIRLLVPPFEHHMGYDHSGYPQTTAGPGITLFGRILTIADVYDAITSPRIYRARIMSPDRALAHMMERSGTHFDPILLKVFINMLGVYPVGTMVTLDTGELGIVVQPSADDTPTRPVVQLLQPAPPGGFDKGAIVSLAERREPDGPYRRNITQTMHPSCKGIQAAAFLLQ